jgi:hypothetical protein
MVCRNLHTLRDYETSSPAAAKNITTHFPKHKEVEDLEKRIAAIKERLKAQR